MDVPPPPAGHDDLGAYARRLATGAASLVREGGSTPRREHDLGVSSKSSTTDLVTAVDRASEQWLLEAILRDRPGDAILGEEGSERAGTSGVRWVLDPIDGTVNFVLGLPDFAVSVAAERDGVVVAGAVCNPMTGELFHAVRGRGAWLGTQRLHGPRRVDLDRAVVGTGFGYDRGMRHRQGRVVAELLARIADVRRIGSAALDLCSVAAGRLDAYYEVGLHAWDLAAGALIAEEAGCVVTGLGGEPAGGAILVCAAPDLVDDLVAVLEELGAADVRPGT